MRTSVPWERSGGPVETLTMMRVVVSGDDQLGRAGQDCVAATEQERVVGRNFVVAFGPLGFLLVQQGGVVRIGVLGRGLDGERYCGARDGP